VIQPQDLEKAEIDLLLEGVRLRYGYDFSNYSFASLRRRLEQVRTQAGLTRYTQVLDRVFHDEEFFDQMLKSLSITVTEMFRDPLFYRAVREHVLPHLRTFPFAKIWHAGCATGQEVYSMAILLQEESFLGRARLYATDFNKLALDTAQKGVYPASDMAAYAKNYAAAGGTEDFSSYFSGGYDLAKVKDSLKERVTFSYHNLVTDGVFGEMNMVCCRNVLIYFDRTLQDRVLRLFTDSLRHGGFLCLGNKETLSFTAVKDLYEPVDKDQRIYKKIAGTAHV